MQVTMLSSRGDFIEVLPPEFIVPKDLEVEGQVPMNRLTILDGKAEAS